jgi:uncharacterized protein YneF (UPF0154 family)
MAKSKSVSSSRSKSPMDSKMMIFVIIALAIGFVGGFFFARDRYIKRIQTISEMNMDKAVKIDDLMMQMKVLGASDSVNK